VFEIEYEMYNAVLRYGDCSDLYIAMFSGEDAKYLESFKAEILISDKDMPEHGNYKVVTYGTNANSFPVQESILKNSGYYTFSFELTEDELKFRPYNEYIEFDLVAYGEDKHAFAEHASKGTYYNDYVLSEILGAQEDYANEPAKFKAIKVVVCCVCVALSALAIFFALKKIYDFKQRNPFYTAASSNATFREIPSDLDPKFAAALVFCKDRKREDDSGVYSAILLSLARKGYVEITELSKNDALITLTEKNKNNTLFGDSNVSTTEEPLELLSASEAHYLNLIKRHATGDSIRMEVLQKRISTDYDYTNSFVNNMNHTVTNCGLTLKYFQKSDYLEPKKQMSSLGNQYIFWGLAVAILANAFSYSTRLDFAFGGFFILGIACLVGGIYLKSQSHKYVLLTVQGEREYNKWRGLYNFLKSDTLINDKTVVELPLWEKYLVYATAFGISEKVIKAIKIHCVEAASAMETKSIVHNTYCRSGRIHSSGRSFHSSVRSGYRGYHSSYGGSYGGGGYSGSFSGGYRGGGGRGGGGGGGGH
jgi:uncharacterized membrane protein